MRFTKKQEQKTDVVVGDAAPINENVKKEQAYLGATQSGLSNKSKTLLVVVLSLLVVASIIWLVLGRSSNNEPAKEPNAAIIEGLKKELKDAKTPEAKADVYMKLSNETVQTSVTKSVAYAEKAVTETGTVATYAQLGFAAEQAGETQKAISAYKKAAELSPKPANPDENTDYNYYMAQANNLSRGGQ